MILAQLPSELQQFVPAKYMGYALAAYVILKDVGRVNVAMKGGATLTEAILSLFQGSSSLPQNKPENIVGQAQIAVATNQPLPPSLPPQPAASPANGK